MKRCDVTMDSSKICQKKKRREWCGAYFYSSYLFAQIIGKKLANIIFLVDVFVKQYYKP
jgi:hypothetical protein